MAIGVGDILRVAARFRWDDLHDIINVWHLVMDGLGTAADDDDVMDAIGGMLFDWYTPLLGSMANNILGTDLSGVNLTEVELLPTVSFGADGSSIGESLPLQTSPMLQFGSATPRHGSRIYLPPLGESAQADGVLVGAVLTVLAGMAADALAGFTDATYGATAHRVAYDRSAGIARDLTSAFIPTTLRTQRRRRQGIGS